MKTDVSRYSQDDSNFEYSDTPSMSAWDEVDLGRQATTNRNTFSSSSSNGGQRRDTRYTTFSLSAYGYDRDSAEMPPFPPGMGIDVGAGRDPRYDRDDRGLIGGTSRDQDRDDQYASGMNYDMPSPDIRPPQPAARRF